MDLTITFCRQTVKTLDLHLQAAFRSGNLAQINRISALLLLADQQPIATIVERLGVGRSTRYAWLHAFVRDRFASLQSASWSAAVACWRAEMSRGRCPAPGHGQRGEAPSKREFCTLRRNA